MMRNSLYEGKIIGESFILCKSDNPLDMTISVGVCSHESEYLLQGLESS